MSSTANYACPNCSRPTLGLAESEVADWKCGVCDTRVKEEGAAE